MHISKSDQTELSKTISCFSSFQMEELRIGLQEDIAKMHTVLAYPKVKVYLVKVIGHPPFFYYSECFMIAPALRDSSGPTRLKYQRKKVFFNFDKVEGACRMASHLTRKYEKKQKSFDASPF